MRLPLICLILLGCLESCQHLPHEQRGSLPPNILIIQADDLGYDDLSLHGNPTLETPFLDSLGRQSARFVEFYLQSVCAPSRASLLTGRHFLRTGVTSVHAGRDYLNLAETLMPEVFQAAGYATGMWGKWHSGKDQGYFPWQRGFDEAYYACLYNYTHNIGLLNGEEITTPNHTTDALTDMAIDFITKHKDQPFLAYVSHLAPHNPWRAPAAYIDKYRQKGLSDPMATLYGMIDHLDHNVGRLLGTVDSLGLAQQTIVIFMSDNGPWIRSYRFGLTEAEWQARNPSGMRGTKGKQWQNGIRSPLFIRWPGHIASGEREELISIEDVFPTLCQLAEVELPDSLLLDGKSFAPIWAGGKWEPHPVFAASHNPVGNVSHPMAEAVAGATQSLPFSPAFRASIAPSEQVISVRTGVYKLIQNQLADSLELFHIPNDPGEQANLATTLPAITDSLQGLLHQWYEGLIAAPHAFRMPEIQVGYPGTPFNQIYACVPTTISAGLINHSHYLSHWQQVGQRAKYAIHVHEPDTYQVYLIHELTDPQAYTFQIGDGKHTVKARLDTESDRDFGTLIEGESAYWENFDIRESFRKSIKKTYMGEILLGADSDSLVLTLAQVDTGHSHAQLDRVIAIQLVR